MRERVGQVDSSPGSSTVLMFDIEIFEDTLRIKGDISFIPEYQALLL